MNHFHQNIKQQWRTLLYLNTILIPRYYWKEEINTEALVDLYLLSDASTKAYGVVAYICWGNCKSFVIAKSHWNSSHSPNCNEWVLQLQHRCSEWWGLQLGIKSIQFTREVTAKLCSIGWTARWNWSSLTHTVWWRSQMSSGDIITPLQITYWLEASHFQLLKSGCMNHSGSDTRDQSKLPQRCFMYNLVAWKCKYYLNLMNSLLKNIMGRRW